MHFSSLIYQFKQSAMSLWSHFFSKTIISFFLAIASFLVGPENYNSLIILGVLIVMDLVSGITVCLKKGQSIESRKIFKTAAKAFVYLIIFSAAHLTEVVTHLGFITTGVLSFLSITELISVVENMAKMGYAVPQKMLNQLRDSDSKTQNKTRFGSDVH